MGPESTNAELAVTAVGEAKAVSSHIWLPMHFGPEVNALDWYVLLNLAVILCGRLINLLDPVPRERALRVALITAVLLFCGVVAWSGFLIVSHSRRFANAPVPPFPHWREFQAEMLWQILTWHVMPALVFGILGICVFAWLWRSARRIVASAKAKTTGTP